MPSFSDIFEWSGWDDFGTTVFYECVLIRDVGSFKEGDEFSNITWDTETLKLRFFVNIEDDEPAMVKTMGLVD